MASGRAFFFAATLAFMAAGMVSVAPAAEHNTQGQLQDVERALEEQRQRKQKLDDKAAALARELKGLSRDSVQAAARVQKHEADLSRLEALLPVLMRKEADKKKRLTEKRDQFTRVLMALQRMARFPPEALLSQPLTPNDTVRGAILLRAAVPEINRRAGRLREELNALAAVRKETEEKRSALAAATRGLKKERDHLKGLMARKAAMRDSTLSAGRETRDRVEALGRQARDLKDLMARLVEERMARQRRQRDALARAAAETKARAAAETKTRAAAETKARAATETKARAAVKTKARAAAKEKADKVAAAAAQTTALAARQTISRTAALTGASISEARGTLFFPVVGRLVGRYGQSLGTGLKRKGISVETRAGAQVIAPFEGIVAFAGIFRGYGRLLIIEHGEGYHTLLAGMDRIQAIIGQRLAAGEPVGVMGAPENGSPALYIELRRDGQPINPRPWLASGKDKVSG